MNWLYAASILTELTALLHIFGGGKSVAKPLLQSALDDEAKYTSYYCWHMATIVMVAMSVCFFLAAQKTEFRDLGILSSALSLAFGVWSVVLVFIKKQSAFVLPQWILFLPIAVISAIGLS